MSKRPDLKAIEKSYNQVLAHWREIDDQLDALKVGRKDTPFDKMLMDNMLCAWEYLDYFIENKDYSLLSNKGGPAMLEINHRVHYGSDYALRNEYKKALDATTEKFSKQIIPIRKQYKSNNKKKKSIDRLAAEVYVAILGQPQLFIEGNHRSGSIIASWINLAHDKPPFVLTVENAIPFFKPAQEIKKFNKRARWRSLTELPKYKRDFKLFWQSHCNAAFMVK